MGAKPGDNRGAIANSDCNDVDFPALPHCTTGWKYYNTGEWKVDHTLHFKCNGNMHSRRWNQIVFSYFFTFVSLFSAFSSVNYALLT